MGETKKMIPPENAQGIIAIARAVFALGIILAMYTDIKEGIIADHLSGSLFIIALIVGILPLIGLGLNEQVVAVTLMILAIIIAYIEGWVFHIGKVIGGGDMKILIPIMLLYYNQLFIFNFVLMLTTMLYFFFKRLRNHNQPTPFPYMIILVIAFFTTGTYLAILHLT